MLPFPTMSVPTFRRPAGSLPLVVYLVLQSGPARAADEGILKVNCSIPGADVYLDGAPIGDAPLTRYVQPGIHQLRVVADDHDPHVRRVEILSDKTTDVNAALSVGTGTVEFTGPPGARLFIGGAERGPLPIRLTDLTPGSFSWTVDAPKYEPASGTVDFVRGKNLLIPVELASSMGVFVIESTPPGATVFLNSEPRGVTPLRLEGIEPGVHAVALSVTERATVLRSVDTTGGERGEVRATLPEAGGELKMVTGEDSARVLLSGTVIGTGAKVIAGPFERGKARVQVETSAGIAEDTVTIPSEGRLSLQVVDGKIEEIQPLYERWAFWAAIGGGVALAGGGVATAVVLSQPDPPPRGETLVTLP